MFTSYALVMAWCLVFVAWISPYRSAPNTKPNSHPDPMAKPFDQSVIAPIERARLNVTQSESSHVQQLHKFVACLFYSKLAYRLLYFGNFCHSVIFAATQQHRRVDDNNRNSSHPRHSKSAGDGTKWKMSQRNMQLIADCLHTIMLYRSDAHFQFGPIAPNNIPTQSNGHEYVFECSRCDADAHATECK